LRDQSTWKSLVDYSAIMLNNRGLYSVSNKLGLLLLYELWQIHRQLLICRIAKSNTRLVYFGL